MLALLGNGLRCVVGKNKMGNVDSGNSRLCPWIGALTGAIAGLLIAVLVSDHISYVPYPLKDVDWGAAAGVGMSIGCIVGLLMGIAIAIGAAKEAGGVLPTVLTGIFSLPLGWFIGSLVGLLVGLIAALIIVLLLPMLLGVICWGSGGYLLGVAVNHLKNCKDEDELITGSMLGGIAGAVLSGIGWAYGNRFVANTVFLPVFAWAGYGLGTLVRLFHAQEGIVALDVDEEIHSEQAVPPTEQQRRQEKEQMEIDTLIGETAKTIENARGCTADPLIIAGLRTLQLELESISDEFFTGIISFSDAKGRISGIEEEAEILGGTSPAGETTETVGEETYYDVLGIKPHATQDEIKAAYRDKVKEYHPDIFSGQPEWVRAESEAMSKKINEAYGVLHDAQRRRKYDESVGL